MKAKKLTALLLALAIMAVGFAGCNSTPEATTQPTATPAGATPSGETTPEPEVTEPQMLKVGLSGIKGLFNPIMSDNVYDTYVVDIMFEGLITNTKEGEYVDNTIATHTVSADNLTYTFTLNDGVTFSDGTKMTAYDVEFTYLTIAHPDYNGPRTYAVSDLLGYAEYHSGAAATFEGIKVIDEMTISFIFPEGKQSPANISNFGYGIMPKDYYAFDTWEDFLALVSKPLGSGPMTFVAYEPDQYVELATNDNYWDAARKPKISGVTMLDVPKESILGALQTGQIHIGELDQNKENVDALNAMNGVSLQRFLGNGYTFMMFNTTLPKLSDVKVRQALMYALDRKSFITAAYGTEELASVGLAPISPSSWAFPDVSELNDYAFDMDKAAALMEEAGWVMGSDGFRYKDGQKFTLSWLVYTEAAWPGILSGMAADSWKQLGVDLTIDLMDFNTVSARTFDMKPGEKDFDIFTMGFSLSIEPDPSGALFDGDAYVEGGFNASGYYNQRAQDLIIAGKAEFDQDKRAEIYKEWAQLMNEEIPTVIVAYRYMVWGVSDKVQGLDIDTYWSWPMDISNMVVSE